ncbi:MAG: hypothetical protein AAF688_08950 [Bacteroidota bacterium]
MKIKYTLTLMILITNLVAGQNSYGTDEKIVLIEEFTISDYETPDKIVFYSSGHYEYEYFYQEVYKSIRKESKKKNIRTRFVFEDVKNWKNKVQFYYNSVFSTPKKNFPIVCFYEYDRINPNIRGYCHDGKCEFYFYVTLVDTQSNQVLFKRKYQVTTEKYYYTQCKNLGHKIINEL